MKDINRPTAKGSLHRCLALIETEVYVLSNVVEAMEPGPELDHCLLELHEQQINSLKSELTEGLYKIVSIEDDDGLAETRFAISEVIFNTHRKIRQFFQPFAPALLQESISPPKSMFPPSKGT